MALTLKMVLAYLRKQNLNNQRHENPKSNDTEDLIKSILN
jgi:hypothetical protein